jgi:hypothetical protein
VAATMMAMRREPMTTMMRASRRGRRRRRGGGVGIFLLASSERQDGDRREAESKFDVFRVASNIILGRNLSNFDKLLNNKL